MIRRLRALWPLRIAPGIALTIVLAVVTIQVVTGVLLYALAPGEIRVYGGRWLADRMVETAREVLVKPRAERAQALAGVAIDSEITLELLDSYEIASTEGQERGRGGAMAMLIRRGLGEAAPGEQGWRVEVVLHGPRRLAGPPPPRQAQVAPGVGRRWDFPIPARFTIAIRGPDGMWLVATAQDEWATLRGIALVVGWLGLAAIVVGALSWLAARRVIRPLQSIASAAERMATVRDPTIIAEAGPPELRAIAHRLNDMQTSLKRFIDDRTQMIAAISHDLRTPLTRLRLRAEFVEDAAIRDKMMDDIAQMQAIVSQTLDFASQDAEGEALQRLDLAALLESLCDDVTDGGGNASYSGPDSLAMNGQPASLRRAFTNLVDNAVAYGQRADVALAIAGNNIVVTVADAGPGLPLDELEKVFRPFYRLEASRNRETGGTGLGLSIARTILRAHGGDITLANRSGGGLVATALMPANLLAATSHEVRVPGTTARDVEQGRATRRVV